MNKGKSLKTVQSDALDSLSKAIELANRLRLRAIIKKDSILACFWRDEAEYLRRVFFRLVLDEEEFHDVQKDNQ